MIFFKMTLICSFSIVTANYDAFNPYFGSKSTYDGNQTTHPRYRREDINKYFDRTQITCDDMANTAKTPFVVVLVFKTAGRFLGMGSIISAKTVLTARRVVENALQDPRELLVVAGCLSPWWGRGSQVKEAQEIIIHERGLALVNVKVTFDFNRNVAAVKICQEEVKDYKTTYTEDYAIFGVFRGSWDVPGDKTSKKARYIMQVETILDDKNGLKECKTAYPDHEFNDKYHYCTSANGTFCWGCLGSPAIAVSATDEVLQIGVVTKTTQLTEKDLFHIHTKIGPNVRWLKGHSHLDYPLKK